MILTGVWRRLGVSGPKPRLWLVVMLLLAVTGVLLSSHYSPYIFLPAFTHLNASQMETVGWNEEEGTSQAVSTHALFQPNKTISVKEAMHPVEEEERVSHGVVCQSPSTPPQQEFPFRYLINEPDFCRPGINIINMIPVAPISIASRLMIRKLWGNEQFAVHTEMRTLFVLGTTSDVYHQHYLETESQTFHDIIQLNFVDSYSNLSLKTLSILHWTQTFCQGAKWILKSDDDVLVNPFALNNLLKDRPLVSFVCKVNGGYRVCRVGHRCKQKWALSYAEYADYYYPPYCDGPAYVISASMARQIYCAANRTHPLMIEDAYFTGILAKTFQPKYEILPRRKLSKKGYDLVKHFWNGFAVYLLNLRISEEASKVLWDKILQYNNISTASKLRQQI
ncbi:beta-1,3-galactosyltransferase 1-like [Panulirus ornatus]|uniref:beta-1,3-galactosyltransferase 1-like n=1 Tax=Panulirus ornatus TaxID=150431 RepID=UPI003A89E352